MNKLSRALLVVVAVLLILPIFTTQASEGIQVGKGTLRIGGCYQGTFSWYEDDDRASEFATKRARLLLFGTLIPEKISYFVQLEAKGSPYLLDSKLILKYIPNTAVTMGRFIPNYTLFMPKSGAKLNLINYPLTTLRTAMWRQTGIQSTTKTDFVDVTLGIYNGYQTKLSPEELPEEPDPEAELLKPNDWGDNNDAKDILLRADIKPMKGMKLGLFGWLGSAYNNDLDEDFDVTRYGVNFEWKTGDLYLAAEYLMGTTESAASSSDVDCAGYFAHVGYNFGENWEIHGRYDSYDANTDADDDEETWITGGINYKLLDWNTMFYLNYTVKDEEGCDIDNDEIVLMFQYTF
ncbi:OprO/OprP family phosphate-selective porin [bacterium]|nr:OprO/OprP family phosphate-selective porin [bacterium]